MWSWACFVCDISDTFLLECSTKRLDCNADFSDFTCLIMFAISSSALKLRPILGKKYWERAISVRINFSNFATECVIRDNWTK